MVQGMRASSRASLNVNVAMNGDASSVRVACQFLEQSHTAIWQLTLKHMAGGIAGGGDADMALVLGSFREQWGTLSVSMRAVCIQVSLTYAVMIHSLTATWMKL